MFKTTKEFEKTVINYLKDVQEQKVLPQELSFTIDQIDYDDILEFVIDNNLVKGISITSHNRNQILINRNNPRLSYNGLKYLESYQDENLN